MAGEPRESPGRPDAPPERHASLDDRFDPAVQMADHDPAWVASAREELARIKDAIGPFAVRVDHIGSTAVPGLIAKPIIDLQVAVSALEPEDRFAVPLERLGYLYAPDPSSPDRHFFGRPASRPRTHHVHVCEAGSTTELRHRAVRDYLRSHPAEVVRYAGLKRDLVAQYPQDRLAYIAGKDAYLQDLEQRAVRWVQQQR